MRFAVNTPFVTGHGSAAQRIESELRRLIIALELPPGSRLSEQDIAERHGVSRQPVREALIGLARTRLVEIQPQRGTTVVKISVRKMMEARFVREAIETAVVRRACASFDQQSRERINDLLQMQEQAARRDDHELVALVVTAGRPLATSAAAACASASSRSASAIAPLRPRAAPSCVWRT